MAKQSEYAKALDQYAKTRDFSLLNEESFSAGKHIMLIEEKAIAKAYKFAHKVAYENALFEKVELTDFWKDENGRTNKTR